MAVHGKYRYNTVIIDKYIESIEILYCSYREDTQSISHFLMSVNLAENRFPQYFFKKKKKIYLEFDQFASLYVVIVPCFVCGRNFNAFCGIFGQEDYILRHEYQNTTLCVYPYQRQHGLELPCFIVVLQVIITHCTSDSGVWRHNALRSNHLFNASRGGGVRKMRDQLSAYK